MVPNSILQSAEDDRINFEDIISLVFMIFGAIFLGIIAVTLLFNIFQFEQAGFDFGF